MTAHTHDDAFHEIQLNGKQLVFLVMAATVVSVAIFLCGVLVGRNVRAQRAAGMDAAVAASAQSLTADVPPVPPAPTSSLQSADPRFAAPPPTVDDADIKRTDDGQTAADVLRPAAPRPEIQVGNDKIAAASAPVTAKPTATAGPSSATAGPSTDRSQPKGTASAPAAVAAAVKPTPAAAASSVASVDPAPGNGYAVQVAALNVRSEADAVAKRLTAKGYAAYVQVPTSGAASVFRVRVGTFKTRKEAESVASRLQKEESFKPWVTR